MNELTPIRPDREPERISEETPIEIGQWYWVKERGEGRREWLGCVTDAGSNFVELCGPSEKYSNSTLNTRVHLDDFHKKLKREHNPAVYIRGRVEHYRRTVEEKLAEVRRVMARLGVSSRTGIEQRSAEGSSIGTLMTLNQAPDLRKYKRDLITAKDEELPALFRQIQDANEMLRSWMSAETIPARALAEGLKDHVGVIQDRVFTVSLYAGLTEQVTRVADGKPADIAEKLHVMQRRLYMDEECLANYRIGGIDFKQIDEFDNWLKRPENRDRILPYPRCMVAFRVRRERKTREMGESLYELFVKIQLEELDKLTFLYIRNGEQVYRMNCDLEFGSMIFPDRGEFDPSGPMMVEMFAGEVQSLISKREYDDRLREAKEEARKRKAWRKTHPQKEWFRNPYDDYELSKLKRYEPFDKSSVYYDEMLKEVEDRIKHYNRIVLIIQGLFDRSPVLHPHPPVKTWTQDGFAAAIKLVYDGTHTLHHGAPPDFEAYRKECNESLGVGSVTHGQEAYWLEKMAEVENARRDRSLRANEYRYRRYKPCGNPGPGTVAKIETWRPRVRKATFRWTRERQWSGGYFSNARRGDPLACTIQVPDDRLFNISAYKPGDYKRFFRDPRTRADYLKWAPALLAAEEYHAGNIKGGEDLGGDELGVRSIASHLKKSRKKKRSSMAEEQA